MSETLIERRARLLGPNVPTFYTNPVHLVRGLGATVWDADGRDYIDCYNNVPHVGHCHPQVVEAIARQSATLNTHTRYLHDSILDYVEQLTARLGHGISQAIMVCTGSEANDIALRMAQAVTGKTGIIATDNTYHGNTAAVSALSTRRPPIGGYPPHVRLVPAPYGPTAQDGGVTFARHVAQAIEELNVAGFGFSGLMLCPYFANEGFPVMVPGFLDETAQLVKAAGGLMIADEVQPGFGRLGSHFWGHDWIGFVPDVVTVGKPMGNGYPVGAALARPDVMAAFRQAFGYFNTFGGNPVAAAACIAVLRVIDDEGLMENAAVVGAHAVARMQALRHPLLVDVRGKGLFFGAEFVLGDGAPTSSFVTELVERMKAKGVLMGKIGRHGNILKMRPPMVISLAQADRVMDALAEALAETTL
jgi:4-aminobutyrate aminotransferase-like enzyme